MSHRNNLGRIYVGNLPSDVRVEDIEDLFYRFGKITFIDLKNKRGPVGPPFAFVQFEDPRDADDAIEARDDYIFDGCRLRVEFSHSHGGGRPWGDKEGSRQGPPARRSEYRCIVSGLPPTGSWQDLKDHMREAGYVCFATVKNCKGLVDFLHLEDMKYAVKKMDNSKFKSHEGEVAYIRVKEDYGGRSRSTSRSSSPRRSRGSPASSPKRL